MVFFVPRVPLLALAACIHCVYSVRPLVGAINTIGLYLKRKNN